MEDKVKLIKLLHKTLFIKEDAQNSNVENIGTIELNQYIDNLIVRFLGIDMRQDLKKEIVESLSGLKSNTVNYTTFRSIVLGLMNKVDRLL